MAKTNSQTDNGRFQKIIVSLDTLKQDNLSDKDKYTALQQSLDYYYAWYRNNNIHSLYTNSHIIEDFAKEFFPSFYNEKDFLIQCQDPQCATTQQPADVDKIIADVQASDFPAEVKATIIQDLKDDGYFQNADDRARNYLESAKIISRYGYYSPSGEHQKISNNLVTFVQNNYPDEYLKYISIINQ